MRSGAGAALRSPTDEAARSRCAPLAEQIGARAMVPAIGVAAKAVTTLAMSGPSAEPQPDSARIRPTLIRRVTSTLVEAPEIQTFPTMLGHIVCFNCSLDAQWGLCDPDGTMPPGPPGHITPPRFRGVCDSWTHIIMAATQRAAILRDPVSAVRQGAREEIEALVARPRLNPQVRLACRQALDTA